MLSVEHAISFCEFSLNAGQRLSVDLLVLIFDDRRVGNVTWSGWSLLFQPS